MSAPENGAAPVKAVMLSFAGTLAALFAIDAGAGAVAAQPAGYAASADAIDTAVRQAHAEARAAGGDPGKI